MLSEAAFSPRRSAALIVLEGQLLLFGGMDTNWQVVAEAWVSPDGAQWVQGTPMPGPLIEFSAVLWSTGLVTTGGSAGDGYAVSFGYAVRFGIC